MNSIYLDHAASTPIHPEVVQTMITTMTEHYGNASSVHSFGRDARRTLNQARDRISQLLRCYPDELVFTSGGTESDNLALFGASSIVGRKGRHIITSSIEHHAILHSCTQLERQGFTVTYVPVDSTGRVNVQDVIDAMTDETVLISIMYGNNEVGTLQPIEEIGAIARTRGILFHVDAVQALGVIPISCAELPVDLMSFSAHKLNGPQGVGVLYVRRGIPLNPQLYGGLQEKKRRAGTENIAGVVGFAKAIELVTEEFNERTKFYVLLRSTFLLALEQTIGKDSFVVNGHSTTSMPHILNISFPEVDTETLLMGLDMENIAVASGSACTSGSLELSHVLIAMGLNESIMRSAIRFSFGLGNTTQEMEHTAHIIGTILHRIRNRT
ncbi:cysteine desulfurase family protein [Paenibacillus sp. CMAA1364]